MSTGTLPSQATLTLTIDGRDVEVPEGTTIWEAARQAGVEIPVLCHDPKLEPVGVCRMCVVDIGERVLAASCTRTCQDGMTVATTSEKVEQHRHMLTRLLLSEYPDKENRQPSAHKCELEELGHRYGLMEEGGIRNGEFGKDGLAPHSEFPIPNSALDISSPVIAVDHAACILCDRCIRACDDLQNNHVIGRTGKGHSARIAFDLNQPMGESTCVSCGECAAVCPTDALTHKQITLPIVPDERTSSTATVCPYCGVGCSLNVHSRDNQIFLAEGLESPVNHGRLCVKGRYGWDYAQHPQRLTKPLIRRDDAYPKGPLSSDVAGNAGGRGSRRAASGDVDVDSGATNADVGSRTDRMPQEVVSHSRRGSAGASPSQATNRKPGGIVDYDEVLPAFREATWEEALDLVGERLRSIRDEHGSGALAGFGSAKCSNEEAYLFQKLIRAGFGTNNVDHCTRLCHASSVAALMETIGGGAVSNVFADVANADVCLITGSHTASNHPVAATFIKEAARRGTKLIVVDVRRHELADFATHFAQIKPGSDVAFFNAVMHVLIAEGLVDREFIQHRTEGFDDLKQLVARDFSPEQASPICGIEPDEIRAIAHTIGRANISNLKSEISDRHPESPLPNSTLPRMLVFWGMGIAQHSHGTDNARCLISLCLMTGNIGKPGTGLHPLRGQNNVQGASDAGLIPIVYPDYQAVGDASVRAKFEAAWGRELDPQPGLTVVEIMSGALTNDIRGMYILGENPFLSDPNANKVRKSLSSLDFLVVQDIFLTETAEFADVILPATSYFEKDGTYTNTDRRVQLGKKILDPPGDARADWQIICDVATRVGLPMSYESPAEIFDEFAGLTKNYAGLSHANLGPTGKLWPCANPQTGDGTQILFGDRFPTASGKGKFVPCGYLPAAELPDDEYPLVLNTGRILEHWHTGSMTRRSKALDAIKPSAFAKLHPSDFAELGIADGQMVRVASRRGEIELQAIADRSIEPGCVFIPFHFREASANLLTNDVLDPYGKIPEYKYCAVRVEAVDGE